MKGYKDCSKQGETARAPYKRGKLKEKKREEKKKWRESEAVFRFDSQLPLALFITLSGRVLFFPAVSLYLSM